MSDIAPTPLAEDLPESLADVVQAIGFAATMKLVEHFGGTRIYPPRPEFLTEEHKLARAIGIEAARKLVRDYIGVPLWVPLAAKAKRFARNRAIRHDCSNMSNSQLARKYRMTERQVTSIAARAQRSGADVARMPNKGSKAQSKLERAAPDSNRIMQSACRVQPFPLETTARRRIIRNLAG